MALTELDELKVKEIIKAFDNGKEIGDLPIATAENPKGLTIEVVEDGESKQAQLGDLKISSDIAITPALSDGTEIAKISIDGTEQRLYTPNDYLPLSGITEDEYFSGQLNIGNRFFKCAELVTYGKVYEFICKTKLREYWVQESPRNFRIHITGSICLASRDTKLVDILVRGYCYNGVLSNIDYINRGNIDVNIKFFTWYLNDDTSSNANQLLGFAIIPKNEDYWGEDNNSVHSIYIDSDINAGTNRKVATHHPQMLNWTLTANKTTTTQVPETGVVTATQSTLSTFADFRGTSGHDARYNTVLKRFTLHDGTTRDNTTNCDEVLIKTQVKTGTANNGTISFRLIGKAKSAYTYFGDSYNYDIDVFVLGSLHPYYTDAIYYNHDYAKYMNYGGLPIEEVRAGYYTDTDGNDKLCYYIRFQPIVCSHKANAYYDIRIAEQYSYGQSSLLDGWTMELGAYRTQYSVIPANVYAPTGRGIMGDYIPSGIKSIATGTNSTAIGYKGVAGSHMEKTTNNAIYFPTYDAIKVETAVESPTESSSLYNKDGTNIKTYTNQLLLSVPRYHKTTFTTTIDENAITFEHENVLGVRVTYALVYDETGTLINARRGVNNVSLYRSWLYRSNVLYNNRCEVVEIKAITDLNLTKSDDDTTDYSKYKLVVLEDSTTSSLDGRRFTTAISGCRLRLATTISSANYKGHHSNAFGYYSLVTGNYSNAFGADSEVSADYATTFGQGTLATTNHQVVMGKYNKSSDALFVIGNGTSDTVRSNCFEIKSDGSIVIPYNNKKYSFNIEALISAGLLSEV